MEGMTPIPHLLYPYYYFQKSGTKSRMIKRIVKKTLAQKETGEAWTRTRLESTLGDLAIGEGSTSGLLRRFYTSNYKALDQFDALWYACHYSYRESSWQSCYLWALILDCAINACSAWCEAHSNRTPIKTFVAELAAEIGDAITHQTL